MMHENRPSLKATLLAVAAGGVIMALFGVYSDRQEQVKEAERSKVTEVAAPAATPTPAAVDDSYEQALAKGKEAAGLGAKAKTWQEFAATGVAWTQAQSEMGAVPATNPNYAQAREKYDAYQKASQVAYDRARALEPPKPGKAEPVEVAEPAAPTMSDVDLLQEAVNLADPQGALVKGIEVRGDIATFTMTFAYLSMNDDEKLEIAKSLQKIWAALHSPDNPDMGHINVKGPQGTTIAKSDWLGATMVKLVD